jgi:hypothetical protein
MNFKKLLRIIKHRLSPKDVIFDNGQFDAIDTKLIMDRDVCVNIAYYDKNRKVYVVLVKPLYIREC